VPVDAELREKRQRAIVSILRGRRVVRQAELVRLLRERGIPATQSSVSRDLQQLGIAKLDSGYRPAAPNEAPPLDPDARLLAAQVRDVRTAGSNLTVVRTAEGAAQRVALLLDRSGWPEIVGTVSGDDTIFVATRGVAEQRRLAQRLRTMLGKAGEEGRSGSAPPRNS
jgi:transcriptional regulator of arginine metabolism